MLIGTVFQLTTRKTRLKGHAISATSYNVGGISSRSEEQQKTRRLLLGRCLDAIRQLQHALLCPYQIQQNKIQVVLYACPAVTEWPADGVKKERRHVTAAERCLRLFPNVCEVRSAVRSFSGHCPCFALKAKLSNV
jgi:hypothetical protein